MSGNPEHTPAADTDPEPVESVDADDAELLVADPDDYHEAQRLREIHDARREVHKVHRSIEHVTSSKNHTHQRASLAGAVAAYIYELMPPLRAAGVDTDLPDQAPWDNLEHFAAMGGSLPDEEGYAPYELSMIVFSNANGAFAELKPLVQTDDTDEWEV